MAMHQAIIKLAPPESFARYLQLAGAGVMLGELIRSGLAVVDLNRSEIRVDPVNYAMAADETLRIIEDGVYGDREPKPYGDKSILGPGTRKEPGANLHVCVGSLIKLTWREAV